MSANEWIALAFIGPAFLYLVFFGGQEYDYPPKDEKGRPMKACFGTRGTPFRWVRRPD